jgi:hypothetical protein
MRDFGYLLRGRTSRHTRSPHPTAAQNQNARRDWNARQAFGELDYAAITCLLTGTHT